MIKDSSGFLSHISSHHPIPLPSLKAFDEEERNAPSQELNPNAGYYQPQLSSLSRNWISPSASYSDSSVQSKIGDAPGSFELEYSQFKVHEWDAKYSNSESQSSQYMSRIISHPHEPSHYNQPLPQATVPARPIPPRLPTNDLKRDHDLENIVSHCARTVLYETPSKCLKSVELANSLRDRIGKDCLQRTKTLYGGLLVLLELFPQYFFVHRIPKNDMVELLDHTPPYSSSSRPTIPTYSRSVMDEYYQVPVAQPLYPKVLPRPDEKIRYIESPPLVRAPTRCTEHYIKINNMSESVNGTHLWREFGGAGVVHKVSLEYQGCNHSAFIYFNSPDVATKSFQLHANGKWKNQLVFYLHNKPVAIDNPVTETRLVTMRTDQLPHFFQEVLREMCNFRFLETDVWKRNVIPDYLFCQLMTEILKPHAGAPIQVNILRQQLADIFGRSILLPPLKAFFMAYPEYFDVNETISLVRATRSDLPSLEGSGELVY